ncbi:hypothetical protein GCM10010524_30730 [Streptomyces mexicanus]
MHPPDWSPHRLPQGGATLRDGHDGTTPPHTFPPPPHSVTHRPPGECEMGPRCQKMGEPLTRRRPTGLSGHGRRTGRPAAPGHPHRDRRAPMTLRATIAHDPGSTITYDAGPHHLC